MTSDLTEWLGSYGLAYRDEIPLVGILYTHHRTDPRLGKIKTTGDLAKFLGNPRSQNMRQQIDNIFEQMLYDRDYERFRETRWK
ncbi:hypothetical protein CFR75_15675 [Komagataeibacter xylinus]|uniref:Uncharacterized protein n=1 Tax=Komagataeibacter xylinus TaxID=28448 RepID=A0A318PEF3_KOMXY|nr:hypothetical protein [Komagataeibacter xylinus]PYD55601.1 hypothetical protein CFR75_15675 [Komagataeibacter xylinus]GBQ70715.1 hypothetical protein AA15237_0918 [Komagataeibacter xylinus NBRC 15237]